MTNIENTKSKIFEALESLVPEQDRAKLEAAVAEFLDEAVKNLETEYDANLEDAYKTIAAEKVSEEKVAIQGYNEAYEIITDLKNRLEKQRDEFENQLEEGYGEAYEMLLAERKKNEDLEVELYEQYEAKLSEVKEYIVDKVDQFLSVKEEELHEMAKEEVLSDPYMLEHKLAWDKVLNLASDWLSDEDYSSSSNKKVDELQRQVDESKHQVKILEAKTTKLAIERDKLNEQVRASQQTITESAENARNERRKTVEGRGVVETAKERQEVVVLKEYVTPEEPARINESNSMEEQWRKLAYDAK